MRNSFTGREDHLIRYLYDCIERAERIRFIVAFLMESGAKLLGSQLADAANRGIPIQILTGRYMSITEPSAIYHLYNVLGSDVEVRFFSDNVRSFHPKAYLFDYKDDSEIIIGSSNISYSALTSGVEWNYRLRRSLSPLDYDMFANTFDELFSGHSVPATDEELKKYSFSWRKPRLGVLKSTQEQPHIPEPTGAQIEALYQLRKAREEGINKGLVVAATGVGKTYLSAFDSQEYKKILYVAHREEILRQAAATFATVRPKAKIGFYFGQQKDNNADILFATVQTLAREPHLHNFSPDSFAYVIVDEFHHAAADSYVKVINYFKPQFLLGLTATPFRTDNKDIFALCGDNVIYEIYLKDAIHRDLLVPFRYFGIYDAETDYSQIETRNGQYVVEQLEKELSRKERADLVLEKYRSMAGRRTLGFCVSIDHAEYMAQHFATNGIKAVAVHSGVTTEFSQDRKLAVPALKQGELEVIFAVDIFNEGVDIPSLDTVMFLRPTESFIVFLQQLGRGLRKYPDKEYLTVLDFIGNYKRAHYIPALLAGENPLRETSATYKPYNKDYPDGCYVQFDFRLLDLFREMAKSDPLPKRMRDEYQRIKEDLGRRPTRIDMYYRSDIPIREYLTEGWLSWLDKMDELTQEELSWLGTPVEEFLIDIEKTSMSKAYKMPTIGSLLNNDGISKGVSLETIGQNFMDFYVNTPSHQKDLRDKSNRNWRSWDVGKFTSLARKNPVHFLSKSRKFFHYDEINRVFYLDDGLDQFLTPALAQHVRDILDYKTTHYFRRRFWEEDD
jgi:superfamily II DNA or RNA helicase